MITAGLLVTWVLATLWSAARFGRFSLERRGSNLVVRRGLIEQQQVTLPVDRIQAVRYQQTLLRQPFGYGALYVETVGHAEALRLTFLPVRVAVLGRLCAVEAIDGHFLCTLLACGLHHVKHQRKLRRAAIRFGRRHPTRG